MNLFSRFPDYSVDFPPSRSDKHCLRSSDLISDDSDIEEDSSDSSYDESIVQEQFSPLIDPNGWILWWWHKLLLVAIVVTAVPFLGLLAFDFEESLSKYGTAFIMIFIIDVLFLVDSVVICCIPYQKNDVWITEFKSLFLKYFRSKAFYLDFLATLPFAPLFFLANNYYWRFIFFLKLFRVYRFIPWFKEFEFGGYVLNHGKVHIAKIIFILGLALHIITCFWYITGETYLLEGGDPFSSWIYRTEGMDLIDRSWFLRYLFSMHWVGATASTTGFGDISPEAAGEVFFVSIVMLLGTLFFAYLTGTLSAVITRADQIQAVKRERLNSIRTFVQETNLSDELANRILQSFFVQSQYMKSDHWNILSALPRPIRCDVALSMYGKLLENSPLFSQFNLSKKVHYKFVAELCANFRVIELSVGEYLMKYGDPVDYLYIVQQGQISSVSSVNTSVSYFSLHPGDTIGESSIFITRQSMLSYRAVAKSSLFKVPATLIHKLTSLEQNNECLALFILNATKRLELLREAKQKLQGKFAFVPLSKHRVKRASSTDIFNLENIAAATAAASASNDVIKISSIEPSSRLKKADHFLRRATNDNDNLLITHAMSSIVEESDYLLLYLDFLQSRLI